MVASVATHLFLQKYSFKLYDDFAMCSWDIVQLDYNNNAS